MRANYKCASAIMALALFLLLISIVGVADDPPCYKDPDLWFPPPGTVLSDGGIAVQIAAAPGSQGEDLIICQGETITIIVTVDNLTCGDAGPFDVSLYYDQFDEVHLIGTERLDVGLEACEYVVLEFTWNTIDVPPGIHSIIAWADVNHEVDELNEENNQYTIPVTVTVRPLAPWIEAEKIYIDENGDSPSPGDMITYEITITNDGCADQGDNAGHEFIDPIPDFMTYIPGAVAASSGTAGFEEDQVVWDGEVPAGGSVMITFQVVIADSTPNLTTICNQGMVHWDSTGDDANDAQEPTDDPSTPQDDDPTCLTVIRPLPVIVAEKIYIDENGGVPSPGDTITYEIEICNHGYGRQGNNPGHEFIDPIPNFMTYIPGSVAASSGTAGFEEDQVVWDGEIPAGGVVTITFGVEIDEDAEDLQEICNQGIVYWTSDGGGTNDVQEPTDDPTTPDDDDPTCLTVGIPPAGYVISGTIDAPTLSEWGAITFSSLFALAFFWMLFRRRRLMVRVH